jgi:class 3 adenylate cyclase
MPANLPRRLERAVSLALALLLLVLGARYAVEPTWQADDSQFVMVAAWAEMVRDARLEPIAGALPVLVACTGLIAAAIALALAWIEPEQGECRRLRRALLLGTAAVLWFFHLRLAAPPFAGRAALDVFAHAAAGLALADLAVFMARFPEPVRLETLHAQMRASYLEAFDGPGWRAAANRRARALFARWLPAGFAERSAAANADWTHAWLQGIGGWRFELAVVGLATGVGLAFAAAPAWPPGKHVADGLSIGSILVPSLAIAGLSANYHHGSEDARRRIGWIWIGPVLGMAIGMGTWLVLLFAIAIGADDAAAHVLGVPAAALVIAMLLMLYPFVTACFVLGLAVAIFHGGSLDPRLAVRRGAVLTLCGVLLTAAFVAIEGALTSQLVLRFELPDQTGAIVAGTLAAISFAPLRRRLDQRVGRWVERWMPVRELAQGEPLTRSVAFADLCGYTALSQRRQHEAVLHASLLHKCARVHAERVGGRLVKTIGDAVLLDLPDPPAALSALRGLADAYARGAATLELEPLPLHGGLHHGEVLRARDGDLFGAGVNLAARLLGAAGEHRLLLSEATHVAAPGCGATPVGPLALKNIDGPVDAFALELGAAAHVAA